MVIANKPSKTTQTSLENRIKRSVHSKSHRFSIVPAPGFRHETLVSLQKIFAGTAAKSNEELKLRESEGVLICDSMRLSTLYAVMVQCATVSEIWMELDSKRIATEDKLEEFLKQIPLELYLQPKHMIRIKAESTASHLYHEGMLREKLLDSLKGKRVVVATSTSCQTLSLRLRRDVASVSISLCGSEFHHRTGHTATPHNAPLQESLAQGCIQAMAEYSHGTIHKSIYVPFAGTGTLGFEYLIANLGGLQSYFRKTSDLESYVFFQKAPYEYAKNTHIKDVASKFARRTQVQFLENNTATAKALQKSVQNFTNELDKLKFTGVTLQCTEGDFFGAEFPSPGPLLVMINPPYGSRLQSEKDMYRNIALKIRKAHANSKRAVYHGCILCPDETTWKDFLTALKPSNSQTKHFTQGGMDIRLCLFRV